MITYPLRVFVGAEEPKDHKHFWVHSDPGSGHVVLNWYGANGWESILTDAGGITDAPYTNQQYTRGNGQWNILDMTNYITVAQAHQLFVVADELIPINNSISDLITLLSNETNDRIASDIDLSSRLEDEISRSIDVENQIKSELSDLDVRLNSEILRAIDASTANTALINTINDKLDNDYFVTNNTYNASLTGVTEILSLKNIGTGLVSQSIKTLPIVSNISAGVLLPETYNTIQSNTERITNLEQSGGGSGGARRITIQETKADLDTFVLPSDAKEGDTAIVRYDETQSGYTTEYGLDSSLQWQFLFVINTTTPPATQTTLGIVKGSNNDGQVFVETDGSMSLNGFDSLEKTLTPGANITIDRTDPNNPIISSSGGSAVVPDATSTVKGIATLGSSGGAARYGQKTDVGLSNVDNTSDLNKPISNATQSALNTKLGPIQMSNALLATDASNAVRLYPHSNGVGEADSFVRRNSTSNIPVLQNVTGDNAIGATQVDSKITTALDSYTYTETDPIFTAWKTGTYISVGKNASVVGNESISIGVNAYSEGIAIGAQSTAGEAYNSIAIGFNAMAFGTNATQLGSGRNTVPGSLQFRGYPLVDNLGKIYPDRLPAITITETDPVFTAWKATSSGISIGYNSFVEPVSQNTNIAIGINSRVGASSSGSISIGNGATIENNSVDTIQLGQGNNNQQGSFQVKNYQLLDSAGKIPEERIPDSVKPEYHLWVGTQAEYDALTKSDDTLYFII